MSDIAGVNQDLDDIKAGQETAKASIQQMALDLTALVDFINNLKSGGSFSQADLDQIGSKVTDIKASNSDVFTALGGDVSTLEADMK